MKNAVCAKRGGANPLYSKGEEIFNAVSHIVGGAIGLVIWVVLLIYSYPNGGYMAAVSAFGLSVITLYTMSALYHFLPAGRGKKVFRIFDHCTIYLLIWHVHALLRNRARAFANRHYHSRSGMDARRARHYGQRHCNEQQGDKGLFNVLLRSNGLAHSHSV